MPSRFSLHNEYVVGCPAPIPKNIASYPCFFKLSIFISFPNSQLVFTFIPKFNILFIVLSKSFLFSLYDGIPYFKIPPRLSSFSNIVTFVPSFASSYAHDKEAGPEPITATK